MNRNLNLGNLASGALIATMVAVGALGWWLRIGPQVSLDTSPLENVPTRIGHWESIDVPVPPAVEDVLRADFNLQRAYVDRGGHVVWLYVGYYGTERGGRPEHTPRGCYTGAGWGIEASRIVDVTPNASLRANEYLVTNSGERRLVHFWYRSHRRTGILGGLDQNVDRMLGRLFDSRADGALIRVSTPLPVAEGDTVAARGRLLSFASRLDPLLGEHWPIEIPCAEVGPEGCVTVPTITGDAPPSAEVDRAQSERVDEFGRSKDGEHRRSRVE